MKKILKIILISIFSLVFFSKISFAYFDPGTGAFIVQAIIAFFSAVIFYLAYPFIKLKKILGKIKEKFLKKNKSK